MQASHHLLNVGDVEIRWWLEFLQEQLSCPKTFNVAEPDLLSESVLHHKITSLFLLNRV